MICPLHLAILAFFVAANAQAQTPASQAEPSTLAKLTDIDACKAAAEELAQ